MMSANRVVASGWMEGSVVVSAARDMRHDSRNSNQCDKETQNSHKSLAGGGSRNPAQLHGKNTM